MGMPHTAAVQNSNKKPKEVKNNHKMGDRMILHIRVTALAPKQIVYNLLYVAYERRHAHRSHSGGGNGSAKGEIIGKRVAGRCGKEIHFEYS